MEWKSKQREKRERREDKRKGDGRKEMEEKERNGRLEKKWKVQERKIERMHICTLMSSMSHCPLSYAMQAK